MLFLGVVMSRRKWVSYIGILGLTLVVLVGALVANMKALAINRERQVILREVRQLEKENRVWSWKWCQPTDWRILNGWLRNGWG
ncbi:MAG: hypothetical protein CL521_02480 [Actinobacteria bacterium]|nr:hypothetical protein [Actinomycetota bacterium]